MNRRRWLPIVVVVGLMLTMAPAALAGKPPKPPKPTTTTTTTTPEFWTCEARIANGAVGWVLPSEDDPYAVTGIAPCIDILAEHRAIEDWTVSWEGATRRGTVKGLKLVFEREVHTSVYAETVVYEQTGVWCPSLGAEPRDNLVFVALPHNGDKWEWFEVTLTPGHSEACPS